MIAIKVLKNNLIKCMETQWGPKDLTPHFCKELYYQHNNLRMLFYMLILDFIREFSANIYIFVDKTTLKKI